MTVFWTTLENIFQHQQLGWWGGGEGWQDCVCMSSGKQLFVTCCSPQAWHLSQEPQVALNCSSSPWCEGCWVPHLPCSQPGLSGIAGAELPLSTLNFVWSMLSALQGQPQGLVPLFFSSCTRSEKWQFWESEWTITAPKTSPGVSTAALGAEPGVGCSHLDWGNLELWLWDFLVWCFLCRKKPSKVANP